MRIYERYFARQVYLTFIFILFAFSGLFFFFDLINELNSVGHGNYKFTYAVLRVALQTPSRFYEIIPVAALISAIYVFAQMAANSEYTIFRVSGLATGQALRSLLKIGIPLVLITYLIGEVVGPYTDQLSERVRLEALGSAVSSDFQSGVWVKDTLTTRTDGEQVTRFVNVGTLQPNATISDVRIYEFDSHFRLSNVRIAKSGVYQPPGHWLLRDVTETKLIDVAAPQSRLSRAADDAARIRAALGADAADPVGAARVAGPDVDVQPVPLHPAPDREPPGLAALRNRAVAQAAVPVRGIRDAGAVAAVRLSAHARGRGRAEGVRRDHARHELPAREYAVLAHGYTQHVARAAHRGDAGPHLSGARARRPEMGRPALTARA
jgi:hypothetical protein